MMGFTFLKSYRWQNSRKRYRIEKLWDYVTVVIIITPKACYSVEATVIFNLNTLHCRSANELNAAFHNQLQGLHS